ncbi:MAG: hypothetical protein K6343_05320 [Caldisericaceae bacterium]
MNDTRMRKIVTVALLTLAILLFAIFSIDLIHSKVSLPSNKTMANEGRFVAYGLEWVMFLLSIPVVISLLLVVYLISPLKGKLSIVVKTLSLLLAIVGFGGTIFLTTSAILNNPPLGRGIISGLLTILQTSQFWIMGILAIVVFKKDKFDNIEKRGYKLGVVILALITVFLALGYIATILAVNIS